jgi:hypothetical protein
MKRMRSTEWTDVVGDERHARRALTSCWDLRVFCFVFASCVASKHGDGALSAAGSGDASPGSSATSAGSTSITADAAAGEAGAPALAGTGASGTSGAAVAGSAGAPVVVAGSTGGAGNTVVAGDGGHGGNTGLAAVAGSAGSTHLRGAAGNSAWLGGGHPVPCATDADCRKALYTPICNPSTASCEVCPDAEQEKALALRVDACILAASPRCLDDEECRFGGCVTTCDAQ